MVHGRRSFLHEGHYQAFADAIIELAQHDLPSKNNSLSILDAGCGEGFYTEQIQRRIPSVEVYGLDISKPAINAAAHNKNVHWCVASSSRPPYLDNSFDMVMSIFSRVEHDAFLRVLKPKGYVLFAGPGTNHLNQLRHIIYDKVDDYSTTKHHNYLGEEFTLQKETSVEFAIKLDNANSIMQLLNMTPHAHRLQPSGYTRLKQIDSLNDIGSFKLYLYQKK